LPSFFPAWRCFYSLNKNGLTGLHLTFILPHTRPLESVREEVRRRLEQVLPILEEENGVKLARPEICPRTNGHIRLPLAADRITITDEVLSGKNRQSDRVKLMEFIHDPTREALPFAKVIAHIKANVKARKRKKKKYTSGGSGMGSRKWHGQHPPAQRTPSAVLGGCASRD
jgi:hypothetical protein